MKIFKNSAFLVAVVQFISYISYGVCMVNLIPYLNYHGFDVGVRGIFLTSYALVNIIIQVVVGYLADKLQMVKAIVISMLIINSVINWSLYSSLEHNFVLALIIVSIGIGLLNTLCGIQDTWIVLSADEIARNLSPIKAFGSIGWGLGSFISSNMLVLGGYDGLGVFIFITGMLSVLLALGVPDAEKNIERNMSAEKLNIKTIAELFKNKNYVLLITGLFIMYSLVVANTTLVIEKMVVIDNNQEMIGLKWTVGSLVEIPMYFLGNVLLKKVGDIKMLFVTANILVIQMLLFSMASSNIQIILITLMQMFTTPILLVVSKRIISQITPKQLGSTAQLLALSIFIGGASIFIPILNSLLVVIFSVNRALFIYTIIGLLGIIVVLKLKYLLTESISDR